MPKYLPDMSNVAVHFAAKVGGLLFFGLFFSVHLACQKPQVWHDYKSSNQEFSVRFPGKPDETTRTSPLSNGEVSYPRVRWTGRGVTLDLSYSEIPDLRQLNRDETKEYYEYLRSQTISLNQSQLMESKDITVNGKLGLDFTEVRSVGKVARFRLFLIGTKLLSIRAEQDVNVRPIAETSSLVEEFMTSVRFPE